MRGYKFTSFSFCMSSEGIATDLLLLVGIGLLLSTSLLLRLALLQEGLGDQNLVVGGNGTAHSFSD